MTRAEEFNLANIKLQQALNQMKDAVFGPVTDEQDEKNAKIMSDTANWCCVHATRYVPRRDKDGNIVIQSTAAATGFEYARNTVHTTLNHVVEDHGYNGWSDCPYVVFAPYGAMTAKNGEPVGMSLIDTYFSTGVDGGLVFPKDSAYLVHPSKTTDTELYNIGEKEATYKANDFTVEEINAILSMMSPKARTEYNRLIAGDLDDAEIRLALGTDKRVKQFYDHAKAKGPESEKAFLRGIMADKCDEILAKYLRDFVTRKAMESKGMAYINDALACSNDRKKVDKAVRDVAVDKKIDAAGDSHARSFYGVDGIQNTCLGLQQKVNYVISEKNMDKLFEYAAQKPEIKNMIVYNDFQYMDNQYEYLEDDFEKYKERKKSELLSPDAIESYQGIYKSLQCKNIEQFDPKLADVLKKQIVTLTKKLKDWRKGMEQNPKFQKLIRKLQDYDNGNFDDYDDFIKPSIEPQFVSGVHLSQER